MHSYESPADVLNRAIISKSWNGRRLAEEFGVAYSTAYRWLRGDSEPGPELWSKMEEVFNLPPDTFLYAKRKAMLSEYEDRRNSNAITKDDQERYAGLPAEYFFPSEDLGDTINLALKVDPDRIYESGVLDDTSDPIRAKMFNLLLEIRENLLEAQKQAASSGVTTYGFRTGATVTVNPGETLEEVSQRLGIDPETG
ncbi:helix-turn-helix transcriptional regulator, partial [Stomatohabitans albus]|uniref:helix-turn-helix domain-containing protein n=1 Tax=Stomatohabitans albus TaxID=3110766 RepID=UPI00300C6E00